MVNQPKPEDGFLETEPDVEGHMVGLPGVPGIADDEPDVEGHLVGNPNDKMPFLEDDTEGHWDGKRIDR